MLWQLRRSEMAILNVQDKRKETQSTLNYIYRGDNHDHKVELVEMIGGNNMISFNPIFKGGVDVSALADQFHQHTKDNYKGSGGKHYIHFMVSLARGEHLTNEEWYDYLKEDLMPTMGFCSEAPWHAAKHLDKAHDHAHVIASLVSKTGSLIDTNEMAKKGFSSMRRLETKHGLQQLDNPGEGFGHHYSVKEIMTAGKHEDVVSGAMSARDKCISKDKASIIRARFKAIKKQYNGRMPTTFSALVIELYKKGVEVKATENDKGGLNLIYRDRFDKSENEIWISASKVGASTYTFKALTSKFNVSYNPLRDNGALGLGHEVMDLSFSVSFKISKNQYERIKIRRALCNASIRSVSQKYWVKFEIGMTAKQRQQMLMIRMVLMLIDALFGSKTAEEAEFDDFLYKEHLKEMRDLNEQRSELDIQAIKFSKEENELYKQQKKLEGMYLEQLESMNNERVNDEKYNNSKVINFTGKTDKEIQYAFDDATIWRHDDSDYNTNKKIVMVGDDTFKNQDSLQNIGLDNQTSYALLGSEFTL
ncbi:MAG: hypothetical protein ACJAS1_003448 [Oleiphilaceae bacterium]|jgi:hypothetical protein